MPVESSSSAAPPAVPPQNRPLIGIMFKVASAFAFSCMGAAVKVVGSITPADQAFRSGKSCSAARSLR